MRWTFSLVLAGCSSGAALLVPPEPTSAALSVIVMLESEGARTLLADELDGGWRVKLALPSPHQITVMYYAESLLALALVPGVLGPGAADAPCQLLAPTDVFRSGDDAVFARGEMTASAAEALAPGGRLRCGDCRPYVEERLELSADFSRLGAAAPLADGRFVALTKLFDRQSEPPPRLFAISKREHALIEGCEGGDFHSIFPIGDQRFVLGDHDGALVVVTIDEVTERCTTMMTLTSTSPGPIGWIAGSPDGRELYTLEHFGQVQRSIDFGPLEVIAKLPIHPRFDGASVRGGIAWIGPGQAVASLSFPELAWFEGGRIARVEPIPVSSGANIAEVAFIGGHAYTGDSAGHVTRTAPRGQPEILDGTPLIETVGTIVGDRDGVVITTGEGQIGRWYPSIGFCPDTYSVAGISNRGESAFIDRAGDLVLPDMVGSVEKVAEVLWLHPTPFP